MALLTAAEVRAMVPQAMGHEDLVAGAIADAQSLADAYCDRVLESASHDEYYDVAGDDQSVVILRHTPITTIAAVYDDAQGASPTELGPDDYEYDPATGVLGYTDSKWTRGRRTVRVQYTAGYTNLTVPPRLRMALRQIAAWVLGSRGDVGTVRISADGMSQDLDEMDGVLPSRLGAMLAPFVRRSVG